MSSYCLNLQEQLGGNHSILMLLLVVKYLRVSTCADCCDGSNECDGFAKCANTCCEAGKASRKKSVKKVKVYRKVLRIRRSEIESG